MPPRHLYVHVPFCARRCSYCDFSIAVRRTVPVAAYVESIRQELALRHGASDERWELDTLYLGGGTPSRLGGDGMRRLIDTILERARLAPGAEVTIEANPDDVSATAARSWRAAGVTRVSLGAQSFDDAALRWMHRTHDARAIVAAVDTLRSGGIDELSLDLIFALPESLERDWEADVEQALALAPDHLSLYGLTVEPHTPLGRWRERGRAHEAPEEVYEREFLHASQALRDAGYEHYEVSNFARSGRRARHNSSYWRGVPYAALGPAAHGFDGESRWWNTGAYAEWARRLAAGLDPTEGRELLDDESRGAERVYLGLRTADGLQLDESERERAREWEAAGWARAHDDGFLSLTPLGWLRLDALAADLTAIRSH